MKKLLPIAFAVSILLASLGVILGTAQLLYNHGHILDPDAQAHVASLLSGVPAQLPAPAALVTPKVTPTPHPVTPTPTVTPRPSVQQIIMTTFGQQYGSLAVRVAQCVSGLNPALVVDNHYGLFQIRLSTLAVSPYPGKNLLDPMVNAQVAYWLFVQSGYQWYRWGVCAPPVANTSSTPVSTSVQGLIFMVFGIYTSAALRVVQCESSFNSSAYNPIPIGNSHAEGLFQILYPSTWLTTTQKQKSPYDAYANVQAAFDIFMRDGFSWREWQCQP